MTWWTVIRALTASRVLTGEVDADARFWAVPVLSAVGASDASVCNASPAIVTVRVRAAANRLAEAEITAFIIRALIVIRASWIEEADFSNAERSLRAVFIGAAFPHVLALVSNTGKSSSAIAVVPTFDVSLAFT